MPAKLPESLLRNPAPPYTIATMPLGAEYDFDASAVSVDEDLSCYLDSDEKAQTAGFISVRRDQDGYHVRVKMSGVSWLAEKIPEERKARLLPVASVTPHSWRKGGQ